MNGSLGYPQDFEKMSQVSICKWIAINFTKYDVIDGKYEIIPLFKQNI